MPLQLLCALPRVPLRSCADFRISVHVFAKLDRLTLDMVVGLLVRLFCPIFLHLCIVQCHRGPDAGRSIFLPGHHQRPHETRVRRRSAGDSGESSRGKRSTLPLLGKTVDCRSENARLFLEQFVASGQHGRIANILQVKEASVWRRTGDWIYLAETKAVVSITAHRAKNLKVHLYDRSCRYGFERDYHAQELFRFFLNTHNARLPNRTEVGSTLNLPGKRGHLLELADGQG